MVNLASTFLASTDMRPRCTTLMPNEDDRQKLTSLRDRNQMSVVYLCTRHRRHLDEQTEHTPKYNSTGRMDIAHTLSSVCGVLSDGR